MDINNQKLEMMRNAPIPSLLLKLGLPTILGMLINALYSIVDAYFIGGLGIRQMGAVSVVFPISQIIVGLGMMFGSGASSYISRLLGQKQTELANQTASTGLFTSLFVGTVTIFGSLIFLTPLLKGLGATDTIMPYAKEYAAIYITGSIFNIFNVTMNNIVTSEGNTKLTMTAMLTGACLNAILDPILIYPFQLGIKGAAFASIIAQMVTSIIYFIYLTKHKSCLHISIKRFRMDKAIFTEIFKIGIPTLVFQLLTSCSIALTNMMAANISGDDAVAAMGIVTRIITLGTYVVFGYMKGFQPVAGYNYEAKLYTRLQRSIHLSRIWATLFCVIMSILLFIFAPQLISAFSQNNHNVIKIGIQALRANCVTFTLFGYVAINMSLFLALGKGKEGGLLSISRQGLFFIPSIFIMTHIMGLSGVIYAQPLADALTIILTFILTIPLNRKLKALQQCDTWLE